MLVFLLDKGTILSFLAIKMDLRLKSVPRIWSYCLMLHHNLSRLRLMMLRKVRLNGRGIEIIDGEADRLILRNLMSLRFNQLRSIRLIAGRLWNEMYSPVHWW